MFILIDDRLFAKGTAFIISPKCVLTAYHNIAEDPDNPTRKHEKHWKIVNGLERMEDDTVETIEDFVPISVTVHAFSYKADWVILKRDDGLFDNSEVVPICPVQELPTYGEELEVKIYHAANQLFNDGFVSAIRPISLSVRYGFHSKHKVFMQAGLFGGSSGALYVISDYRHRGFGKALGMHVCSISTKRKIKDVLEDGKEDADSDEVLEEVTDSCVSSHASFVEGIIISRYNNLMNAII